MNWQKVLSRLNSPGLLLLALGAVACLLAGRLCSKERLGLIVRMAGLACAVLGAVILLDFIPGL